MELGIKLRSVDPKESESKTEDLLDLIVKMQDCDDTRVEKRRQYEIMKVIEDITKAQIVYDRNEELR